MGQAMLRDLGPMVPAIRMVGNLALSLPLDRWKYKLLVDVPTGIDRHAVCLVVHDGRRTRGISELSSATSCIT
ncbi:MAG: hypothetical protein ACR2QO_27750 [Acidimicrobiales bacterium]